MSMKEEDVIGVIVKKLIDNGAIDELVVATLESALDTAFWDLEHLCNKEYLQAHHWQDYADNLQFAHSCIKVLRYFSLNEYTEEQVKANQYSLKIEELY